MQARYKRKRHNIKTSLVKAQSFVFFSLVFFLIIPLFKALGFLFFRFNAPPKKQSYWLDKSPLDTSPEGMKKMG